VTDPADAGGSDADGAGDDAAIDTDDADDPAETPRIRALDERTVNRIAAGEVVERPASVVKELVENSLDADADRIDVAVQNGGIDGVRVRDDGVGMTRDEAKLAVEEHTTSKIDDIEDLEAGVGTLGFRGEALHTIGAVSRLTLRTRLRDGDGAGTELRVEGGEVTAVGPAGVPGGAIVAVEDLFYNTPARRKFLKSRATEFDHVNGVVTHYALANPDVAVSLEHDGREVFATDGRGSLESTVLSVYGREVAESMIPVEFAASDAVSDEAEAAVGSIEGLVSHPETTRSGREYLSTFVNGRYVTAGSLRDAVIDAYGGQLAPDRYPFAVLFAEVPPESVDVNVHPRKMEVRFDDEGGVTEAVTQAVREALLDAGLVRSGAPRGRSAPEETEIRPGEDGGRDAGSGDASATGTDSAAGADGATDDGVADASAGGTGAPDTPAPDTSATDPGAAGAGTAPDSPEASTADAAASGDRSGRGGDPSATSDAWDAAESWSVDGDGRTTAPGDGADGTPAVDDGTVGPEEPPDSDLAGEPVAGADSDAASESAGETDVSGSTGETDVSGSTGGIDASGSGSEGPDGSGDDAAAFDRSGSVRAPTAQKTLDGDRARTAPSFDRLPSMRVLGQAFDTYLVAETGDGLVLIDQHAADERVNYERLRDAVDDDATAQSLAAPVEIELTAREAALFDAYVAALRDVGFRAERTGDRTVAVTAVPAVFDETLDPELLRDALAGFVDGEGGSEAVDAVVDDLLADLACYPSITGNTSLREGSVVDLLSALDDCENPYACPHGRPVIVAVDRDEIEDRFERDYPGHAGRRRD